MQKSIPYLLPKWWQSGYNRYLGDPWPEAVSRVEGIFVGKSLLQERKSPWAITLTEPVPEAFEFPTFDWQSLQLLLSCLEMISMSI